MGKFTYHGYNPSHLEPGLPVSFITGRNLKSGSSTPSPDKTDFLTTLEIDLRLRGLAFERGDLIAWVEALWPRIVEEPDVLRWAEAFAEQLVGETR
jgi:hypothetical protein